MNIKIGLAQLNSNDDLNRNLNQIIEIIHSAEVEKPDLIVFPENSLFFRIDSSKKIQTLQLNDPVFLKLETVATRSQIALHLTTALLDQDGKVYNSSILIQPEKKSQVIYRKIHLFDIELKNQAPIRESDFFSHGVTENIFEINGFRFGSSICYDVRFAELYSKYAAQQVDAILVPSAFLVKTGQVHWEVLLRARAIESQCYVLAPAQVGTHQSHHSEMTRQTYGHSMAVDPWGQVIVEKDDHIGLLFVELKTSEISFVRQQIPMKNHRRL